MKSNQTIIRKNPMEQLHFITKLLDIKDPNIQIIDIINKDTHKEIIAKLDYDAPSCPYCGRRTRTHDLHIIFVVGKSYMDLMEQLHFITKLLELTDPNF